MPLLLPFDDTVVKKPLSWPLWIVWLQESATSMGDGAVCTFQVCNRLPPLDTTRLMPSLPVKYDSAHQQAPALYTPSTLFVLVLKPPSCGRFSRKSCPSFPLAVASHGVDPG